VIPQANIVAWRSSAPWQDDAMAEQDLVLTRAVIELFNERGLADKIAMRGGTALHKLFIQPAYRYSEDIDLVQTESGAIGPILDAIRKNLDPWLGKSLRNRSEGNVTLTYRFQSEPNSSKTSTTSNLTGRFWAILRHFLVPRSNTTQRRRSIRSDVLLLNYSQATPGAGRRPKTDI
jgi:hypothetical protein